MLATEMRPRREVFTTPKTMLLEAKDSDKLVFWGQPLVEPSSRFIIVRFAAELHPTLHAATDYDLKDLGLILDGKSKLTMNSKDYWDGPTSQFLKYMIRINEGTGVRLMIRDGEIVTVSDSGFYMEGSMPVAFTMDFKGRLRADSPWAVRVWLRGYEERPVDIAA